MARSAIAAMSRARSAARSPERAERPGVAVRLRPRRPAWTVDERWRNWRRRHWIDRSGVYLAASAGGALGGVARWAVTVALPTRPGAFPWSTLLINVLGCFVIGVVMVLILDVWTPRRYVRPFLVVGILGGFTTFSTYAVESRALLGGGHFLLAAAYVAGMLVAGLGAVRLGLGTARLVTSASRR